MTIAVRPSIRLSVSLLLPEARTYERCFLENYKQYTDD